MHDSLPVLAVTALALDGTISFDLGCVVQLFGRGAGPTGEPAGFTLTVCGERRGPVPTPDGFALRVEHGLEALDRADLVIVPGRYPHDARPSARVRRALQDAHARGTTLMSICIGAFVLADSGILDGRPATTHWAYAEDLGDRYPRVDLRPDALFVDDGDVLTSAGLAAGLDLGLHVVRREVGEAAAADLARWNVLAPHRHGGQAQFIPPVMREAAAADGLAPTLDWALARLDEPLTVDRLARQAHMSPRTFNRRFTAQVGTTPKRWLLDRRVGLARELLETTDLPIERVADRSGFASVAALRSNLRRHVPMTPSAYRRAYRGGTRDGATPIA